MHFNFDIFKKHPYWTAAGAIAIIAIVWYMSSQGGGGTSTTAGGLSQADLQMAQLQAASQSQQLQAQTQLQAAGIAAGVQNNAIASQQAITDAQTAAQLAAIQAQTGAQVDINKQTTDAQTQQTQAMANVIMDQYDQQTAQQANVVSYLNNLTNAQATVAGEQVQAGLTIAQTAQQNQYNLSTQALSHVTDVNGSQNRVSIIESATGNIPGSVAAEYGQTASSISGDTLLSGIGRAAGGALSALFA